jgi:hypothetical protein
MAARVIFLFFASLLIGSGWTIPAQAFSGDLPQMERTVGAYPSCLRQLESSGAARGDTVVVESTQAEPEAGTEQPEMLCRFDATEPASMASGSLAPSFEVRTPIAPFLDGPDRPPKASALAC